jgi:tetratricopeptide (TPR) repeat protein
VNDLPAAQPEGTARRAATRSRPRRPLLLALSLVALSVWPRAGHAAANDIPAARQRWVEVRTPSFVVLSSTGKRKAQEIAVSFERFRQALELLRPGVAHRHPVPLRVIVFDDDRGFAPYKLYSGDRRDSLVGQFQHAAWADFILFNGNPREGDALPVAYHEYVHAFLRTGFRGVPLWLEEGLAEMFSTFAIVEGEIVVGLAEPDHVRLLRERTFLPLAELLAADQGSPVYRDAERAGLFYAQSWLLAHYVMLGSGERSEQVRDLLDRLRAGEAAESALHAAFGRSTEEIERQLRGYVNAPGFPFLRVPMSTLGIEPETTVREVGAPEVLYELGTALAMRGPETATAARAHLEAAAAGGVPDAWASLGWVEQQLGHPDVAAALYEKAVVAGAGRALSLALRAHSVVDADATMDEARSGQELARRALALEPSYAEAQAILGRSFLLLDGPAENGIAALEAALELLPTRPDIAHALAILRLRQGDVAAADQLVREVVVPFGTATLATLAQAAVEREKVRAFVGPALESGDLDRAEEALQTALEQSRDPGLRAELTEGLARVGRHRASARKFAAFNDAIALANAGDTAAARERLEALRSETGEEPALSGAIDDALGKIPPRRP